MSMKLLAECAACGAPAPFRDPQGEAQEHVSGIRLGDFDKYGDMVAVHEDLLPLCDECYDKLWCWLFGDGSLCESTDKEESND